MKQVVVMGVTGTGKSTVGEALAERLQLPFLEGDDLHPPANIEKMQAGEPLDDADREPWLQRVGAWLAEHPDGGVVACSALKHDYRDLLRHHAPAVVFLLLHGDLGLIRQRQSGRPGHFMPGSLLDSQLATLEPLQPDECGVTLDIGPPVDQVVAQFLRGQECG